LPANGVSAALKSIYGQPPEVVVRSLVRQLYLRVLPPGPPFDPYHYAKALGLDVQARSIEAEGVFFEAASEIVMSRSRRGGTHQRRSRFTLAHEVGHALIRDAAAPKLAPGIGESDEEERLADIAASELVMPHYVFAREFEQAGAHPLSLLELSRRYDVSLQALAVRAVSFGRGAIAIGLFSTSSNSLLDCRWASPAPYRKSVFCYTDKDPIGRALRIGKPASGVIDVILNSERRRLRVAAIPMSGERVLATLVCRSNRGSMINQQPKSDAQMRFDSLE
jgi:hypothetical protein